MPRIRLLTFNIAHARGLDPIQGLRPRRQVQVQLRRIARLLLALKPDIVALQEIDENSRWNGSFDHLEYLRRHAGFPHAVFGINNRHDGRFNLSYGNAILSRHPVAEWENVAFGRKRVGEKGFLFAELEVAGRRLPLVNLHLHASSRLSRLRQIGRLTEFLSAKRGRRRAHWLAAPILCGDLNNPAHRADATASLFAYFSAHGRYTLHPPPGAGRTFPSPLPSRALDFVFLPPEAAGAHSEVVKSLLSDHRPVLVDFELK